MHFRSFYCLSCCKTAFSRCGLWDGDGDWAKPLVCLLRSVAWQAAQCQAELLFSFHRHLSTWKWAGTLEKVIRHRPLRAIKQSGSRLPDESVTGMASGRPSSALMQSSSYQDQHPILLPAAPVAQRNLVNFCSWFYLGACGKGCASSPGHLLWVWVCLGGSGTVEKSTYGCVLIRFYRDFLFCTWQ